MKTSFILLFAIAFCLSAQAQIATTIVYVNSGDSIKDTITFGGLVEVAGDLKNGDLSMENTYSVTSVDSWSAAASYISNHPNESVEVAGHGIFDQSGNFTGYLSEAGSQLNGSYPFGPPDEATVQKEINPAQLNYCGENGTNAPVAVYQVGQKIADKTGSIYIPPLSFKTLMLDDPNWANNLLSGDSSSGSNGGGGSVSNDPAGGFDSGYVPSVGPQPLYATIGRAITTGYFE